MRIMLELSEADARKFAAFMHADGTSIGGELADSIAAQVEGLLPQPRIPEPGQWAVVQADTSDYRSVHFVNWGGAWVSSTGYAYTWDSLIDPVLIREGV